MPRALTRRFPRRRSAGAASRYGGIVRVEVSHVTHAAGAVLGSAAMADRRPCGKHVELVTNDSVRITQCPCGTVHVTFAASGVTLRMNEATLKGATAAFISATDKVGDDARPIIN
jgi:hypothetical protein